MNTKKTPPRLWRWVVGALGLALACSVWAAWGGSDCRSCQGAAEIFHGRNVAVVGVLYYGLLLAVSLVTGPNVFVYSGIALATGVHGGLLAILIQSKLFCAPCIATALSAAAALVFAVIAEPANAFRSSFIIPGAALAVQSWVLVTGALPAITETRASASRVAQEELSAAPVEPGRARMVIYTRADCGYCMQLERDIMPGIVSDFGARLAVERRSAESLPGIPTPTIILTGSDERRMFPGLPPREELERAIRKVMGEAHGS